MSGSSGMAAKRHRGAAVGGTIVQVMPKEKFTGPFIEFTRAEFPDLDVLFLVYGPERTGYVPSREGGVVEVGSPAELLSDGGCRSALEGACAIVVNWVSPRLLLGLWPLLGKAYLLFWGGDIYRFSQDSASAGGAKREISRLIMKWAIRRARGVLTLIPSDLCQVERVCPRHGKWMPAMMIGGRTARERPAWRFSYRGSGPTRVLLGNSATPSNRHAEMLRALARFAGEDLVVYAPLSYGDEGYAREVAALGGELLGGRFVPLTDFVGPDEYRGFLGTIDIGVFNHDRQQGMGNINALMMNGSKVYISPDSGMWGDFGAEGRVFFSSGEIASQSFGEFVAWDEGSARRNWEILDPVKLRRRAVEQWGAIYRDCLSGDR